MSITSSDQPQISVTFVNSLDQSVISVASLPFDQLSKKMEKLTTLNLDGQEWNVAEVIPATAKEIAQTEKLTLKLSKVQHLTPRKPLFSLPTLANKLPFMDCTSAFDAFSFEMHEENWRQAEFLTRVRQMDIEQEIQAITNIWEHHREETDGNYFVFNKLHVRSKISSPRLNIDFSELQVIFGTSEVGALKMPEQEEEFVEDGFAIRTPVGIFYGIVYDDNVELLGVHALPIEDEFYEHSRFDKKAAQQALQTTIQTIANKYNLIFVNWRCCETIPATTLLS